MNQVQKKFANNVAIAGLCLGVAALGFVTGPKIVSSFKNAVQEICNHDCAANRPVTAYQYAR